MWTFQKAELFNNNEIKIFYVPTQGNCFMKFQVIQSLYVQMFTWDLIQIE